MAFIFNYFSNKSVAPERVATDTVVPLFAHDDTQTNRSVSLELSMKFDEVLDADKLSGALWKLLQKPGWKKLGARLRLNVRAYLSSIEDVLTPCQEHKKLEYHIPAHYTASRPPFNYTHNTHPMPISQHPLGAQIPVTNGKLQIFDHNGHFRVLTGQESNTVLLEDWIYADKAQLGLHIASFDDATIVTITWLHTLLDAMGRSALLRAWMAVLEGREEDVPDFVGFNTDPLADLGKAETTATKEEFVLKDKKLSGLGMLRFIFNYLWELYWYPVEEGRMVCMPASHFSEIKAQAFADLQSLDPALITFTNNTTTTSNEKPKPFLSDGDILTAWTTRLLVTSNPSLTSSAPTRLISTMNIFGLRDLLRTPAAGYPALLPPVQKGSYIHNCASSIYSHFTVHEYLTLPLGHIAARIRSDLVKQGTRAQVEAQARLLRQTGNEHLLYGSGDMKLTIMTNWAKAKLYEVEFSAAIVKESRLGKEDKARGKPRYIHVFATCPKGFTLRGSANCIGRDAEGNWWLGCLIRKELVPELVRAVKGMS
jgi:hypothetical protein